MTAEVAVINRSGIALAADSAVTIGQERVWKYTNKIFPLSPHNDMAIMIYGTGDFQRLPWEVVIRAFRKEKCCLPFATISECKSAFRDFLLDSRWDDQFSEQLTATWIFVKLLGELKNSLSYDGKIEFRRALIKKIQDKSAELDGKPLCISDLSLPEFEANYGDLIEEFARDQFKEVITKPIRKSLVSYFYKFVVRSDCTSNYETGIVFCGFGRSEFLPQVVECIYDGIFSKRIRFWDDDVTDLNQSKTGCAVLPFAQKDVATNFMEGISLQNLVFLLRTLRSVLDAKSEELVGRYVTDTALRQRETGDQRTLNNRIMQDFFKQFQEFRNEQIVQPVLTVVSALPREEMADMAQALVEITSLRRKVDSKVESVGGPVDVAFISKSDGFVWIKRKHYFNPDLNPDFFERKKLAWEKTNAKETA